MVKHVTTQIKFSCTATKTAWEANYITFTILQFWKNKNKGIEFQYVIEKIVAACFQAFFPFSIDLPVNVVAEWITVSSSKEFLWVMFVVCVFLCWSTSHNHFWLCGVVWISLFFPVGCHNHIAFQILKGK